MKIKNVIRFIATKIPFINDRVVAHKIAEKKKHLIDITDIEYGEQSKEQRDEILEKKKKEDSKYVEQFLKTALLTAKRGFPERANNDLVIDEICKDMLWCNLAYGFQFEEYMMFDFASIENNERKKFISDTDRYAIYYKNNNFYDRMVFIDKYNTYIKFAEYYKRKIVCLKSWKEFEVFTNFVKQYPKFVLKKPNLSRGDSVKLYEISDLSSESLKHEFEQLLKDGTVILEEKIEQAEELKVLHPASLNTLRLTTFYINGEVTIFYPFMRTGQANSFVDNGGKGGIFLAVDVKAGTICSDGVDEFGRRYVKHPDTGITFKGYKIPKWDACVSLVKECALKMPKVHIIGWDVACTEEGWVIVEGNAQGQFVGQQGTIKRGLKEEIFEVLDR